MFKKRPLFLVCLLVVLPVLPALGAGTDTRNRVLEILRLHAPSGYKIITDYEALALSFSSPGGRSVTFSKGSDFMKFIEGSGEAAILKSVSTAVHEICHGLTSRKGTQMAFAVDSRAEGSGAFFLGGQYLLVPHEGKAFPSCKMKKMIPKKLQTFRFETYVEDDDEAMGTQQDGIYGLFDEWHAYYQDMKTSVALWSYYRAKSRLSAAQCGEFFSSIDGTLYAHGEFKLYVATALRYARTKEPAFYATLLANRAFARAVRELDAEFGALIAAYFAAKPGIMAEMKNKGVEVRDEGEYIYCGDNGTGTNLATWKLLETALARPDYVREFAALERGSWQ